MFVTEIDIWLLLENNGKIDMVMIRFDLSYLEKATQNLRSTS